MAVIFTGNVTTGVSLTIDGDTWITREDEDVTNMRIPEHSIGFSDDIRSAIPTYPVTGSRRR
jgi:hypothetical protein